MVMMILLFSCRLLVLWCVHLLFRKTLGGAHTHFPQNPHRTLGFILEFWTTWKLVLNKMQKWLYGWPKVELFQSSGQPRAYVCVYSGGWWRDRSFTLVHLCECIWLSYFYLVLFCISKCPVYCGHFIDTGRFPDRYRTCFITRCHYARGQENPGSQSPIQVPPIRIHLSNTKRISPWT